MNLTRQTRREAMGLCARVMLAWLTPGAGFASSAPLWAQTSKHSEHRFKIGVCDWTAGKRADPAALEVAKRLGLDGIMPLIEGKVGSHGNDFKASDSSGDVVRHVNACGRDAT